jgi:hypothetical protein
MRAPSTILFVLGLLALASPAMAKDDKPGHSHGHGGPPEKVVVAPPGTVVVSSRDRRTVYAYYRTEYLAGSCPPGLAKKGTGCLPPGQAQPPQRVWVVGQPLPPTVVYYPLPPPLVAQLAPPPPGYEYARVDNDVLLVDSVNRMVADLVADLSDFD